MTWLGNCAAEPTLRSSGSQTVRFSLHCNRLSSFLSSRDFNVSPLSTKGGQTQSGTLGLFNWLPNLLSTLFPTFSVLWQASGKPTVPCFLLYTSMLFSLLGLTFLLVSMAKIFFRAQFKWPLCHKAFSYPHRLSTLSVNSWTAWWVGEPTTWRSNISVGPPHVQMPNYGSEIQLALGQGGFELCGPI